MVLTLYNFTHQRALQSCIGLLSRHYSSFAYFYSFILIFYPKTMYHYQSSGFARPILVVLSALYFFARATCFTCFLLFNMTLFHTVQM